MDNRRVNYFVDKANGVVVAEINGCSDDANTLLNDKFVVNVTSGMSIWEVLNSKFEMNKRYKAVARLHPSDEWDENLGKAIALDKLTETYHHSMNKRLALYAKDFRKIADEIDQYLAKRKFPEKNIRKVIDKSENS